MPQRTGMKAPLKPGLRLFLKACRAQRKQGTSLISAALRQANIGRYWLSTDVLVYGANPVLALMAGERLYRDNRSALIVLDTAPDVWNYPLVLSGHYDELLRKLGAPAIGPQLADAIEGRHSATVFGQLTQISLSEQCAFFGPPSDRALESRAQQYFINEFKSATSALAIGAPLPTRALCVGFKKLILVSDVKDGGLIYETDHQYTIQKQNNIVRLGTAAAIPRNSEAFKDAPVNDFETIYLKGLV